jgi:hypothetical protein
MSLVVALHRFAARHPVVSAWALRLWQPALIVLFVAALLPGQLRGERPASCDHVVHYTKAVSFLHRLETLDLWSWDWRMFAGYPTEYGYPITAEVLVVLCWGAALGSITLSHAYALTFFAVYVFSAWAVYGTFRRWIGRPAAALTVFFYLTDIGWVHEGGWLWTVLFGVWPNFLSIALGLIFLERCVALVRDGAPVRSRNLACVLALTLLTHPLQLVLVPLMLVGFVFWIVCEPELRNRVTLARGLRCLAPSLPIAGALVAFWYVPFLANARLTQSHGIPGIGIRELLTAIATGHPFHRTVPVAAWAGFLGVVIGVFKSGTTRLVGIMCGLCLAAMTTIPRDVVASVSGFDLNHSVEFARITMLAKPFWFAAAAWLLVAIARIVHRRAGRLGLGAAVVAFAAAAAWNPSLVTHVAVPFPLVARTESEVGRLREVGRWLDARADASQGVFRAGHTPGDDEGLVELGTLTRVPLVKFEFTPALNYRSDMRPVSPEVRELIGLRYLVVSEPLDVPGLELRARLDPYSIYEYPSWNPSPVRVLQGEGAISGAALGPRRVRFDAAPGAAGTALVAAGYFPNWRATRNGEPIPIAATSVDGEEGHTMMTVALAPGHYELSFVRLPFERAAFFVSFAAWSAMAIWGALQAFGRRLAFRAGV